MRRPSTEYGVLRTQYGAARLKRPGTDARRGVGVRLVVGPPRPRLSSRHSISRNCRMNNDPKMAIARGLFDSPVQLLRLAQQRADDLALSLGMYDDAVWIRLFDFAIAINSLRDWVVAKYPELDRHTRTLSQQPPIAACRDMANAGKHVMLLEGYPATVKKITQSTRLYTGHATPSGSPTGRKWDMKVVLHDGSRANLEDVANDAVLLWESFFKKHSLFD